MRRKLSILAALIASVLPAFAQDGRAIMEKLDAANDPSTTHALIKMELIDTDGSVKDRVIEEWSADDNQELTHSVMVFHTPASVQNTRFLVAENDGRDDDQWIYLPALRKVRRIASSEGGDSFMGTEFSYDDMKSKDIDEYKHTYLRDEKAQGYDCTVIESIPLPDTDSQYSKVIHWVTKDEEIMSDVKMELYDKNGNLFKVFTVEVLENIDGYWTPMNVIMKNVQNGKSTRLTQEKIELDKPVNPRRFTSRYLQTGRTE